MVAVFYINLDRDRARRVSIEGSLKRAGIHAERIAAIDGRSLPEWAAPYFPPSKLRPGEIGCYASHLLTMQTVLERGLPYALVLEDDAVFDTDAFATVDRLVKVLPDGWDYVHMVDNPRGHPFAFRRLQELTPGRSLVRYSRLPTSTAAYLVSAGGARKFLVERSRTIPIDHDTRAPWRWDLDAYGVERSPFRASGHASSIGAIGGHSRMRRGLGGLTSGYRSPQSALFNIRKLGLTWWAWCLMQNAAHKVVRMSAGSRTANRVLPLGSLVREF